MVFEFGGPLYRVRSLLALRVVCSGLQQEALPVDAGFDVTAAYVPGPCAECRLLTFAN
jgi:hypothetical protein